MRLLGALGLILLACACGSPTIEGPLSYEDRMARMQACNKAWRADGFDKVVQSPGAGRVDQIAFDALGPSKQKRLAEVLACLRTNGKIQEMSIEFYVTGRTIRTISASNNIDFAAEFE